MTIRGVLFLVLLICARFAPAAEVGLSNYRLAAGDTISITVFEEKELSIEKTRLSDAGTISYPMLGEIRVLGMTVSELEQSVVAGLKKYLVDPKVSVSIDVYRDVFVNGQVHKPGGFPYQPGLTVRKAVSVAGGFKDRASLDNVMIIHEGDPTHTPHKVDLNAPIAPGDIITVEESFF